MENTRKRLENLLEISQNPELGMENFLSPENENEALYQEICRKLNDRRLQAENKRSAFHTELTDYYTMWVHQIKTPIAAAGLLLQEEKPDSKVLQNELFKIEQYVDMVLGYLRTEDMAADMQLEKVDLDHLIREQIHKFARIFIGKKLALDYQGVTETVLTDEKWLGFVIGQLLSNALKYTKKGKISIYMRAEEPHTLVIRIRESESGRRTCQGLRNQKFWPSDQKAVRSDPVPRQPFLLPHEKGIPLPVPI